MLSPLEVISDDVYRGMIAVELIEGLKLPLWDYAANPYGGGSLLAGLWTTPFFLIFGKNLFALRFAPFLWHFYSLIAWYFVFKKYFSPKRVFLILLLFVIPPPRITEYMLLNNGYHFEMLLWMALSILLLKKVVENAGPAFSHIFLLGLLGGFSSSMILTNLVTVAAIWIYLVFLKNTPIRKSLFYGVYLLGFLTGFAPWLLYNWHYGWLGLDIVKHFFAVTPFLSSFSEGIVWVFQRSLRGLLGFREFSFWLRHIFTEGFILTYLVSLGFLFWRKKSFIESFGLVFQCLILGLNLFFGIRSKEHYLFPLLPFMAMTLVIFAMRFKPLLRTALLLFLLAAGVMGNAKLVSLKQFGVSLSRPGYSYIALGEVFDASFKHDFSLFREKVETLMSGRPKRVQKAFYSGFSSQAFAIHDERDILPILDFIENADSSIKPILLEKLGIQLGLYARFDYTILQNLLRQFGVKEGAIPKLYGGIIKGLNWTDKNMDEMLSIAFLFCHQVRREAKPFCYEAIGELVDPGYIPSKMTHHKIIFSKLEDTYKPYYLLGLGRYFASEYAVDPKKVEGFLIQMNIVDPQERERFFKGVSEVLRLEEGLPL